MNLINVQYPISNEKSYETWTILNIDITKVNKFIIHDNI